LNGCYLGCPPILPPLYIFLFPFWVDAAATVLLQVACIWERNTRWLALYVLAFNILSSFYDSWFTRCAPLSTRRNQKYRPVHRLFGCGFFSAMHKAQSSDYQPNEKMGTVGLYQSAGVWYRRRALNSNVGTHQAADVRNSCTTLGYKWQRAQVERESKRKRYFYIYIPPFFSQLYIPGSFHLRERDTGLRPAPRLTAKSRRFTTLFGPHIPPRGFPPLFSLSLYIKKEKEKK